MAAPVVHPSSQRLYDALGRGFTDRDESTGWQLLLFMDSIGTILGEVEDIVRETDAGAPWTGLFDIDRVPAKHLAYLGQFIGVEVDRSLSEEDQREQIRSASGWKRGTPAAIIAAVQFRLTASKRVFLVERDTSPYHFKVSTYQIETPDPAAVVAAILTQKPAGVFFTHEILASETWQEVKNNFGTWQDVKTTFATWHDVRGWVAP